MFCNTKFRLSCCSFPSAHRCLLRAALLGKLLEYFWHCLQQVANALFFGKSADIEEKRPLMPYFSRIVVIFVRMKNCWINSHGDNVGLNAPPNFCLIVFWISLLTTVTVVAFLKAKPFKAEANFPCKP